MSFMSFFFISSAFSSAVEFQLRYMMRFSYLQTFFFSLLQLILLLRFHAFYFQKPRIFINNIMIFSSMLFFDTSEFSGTFAFSSRDIFSQLSNRWFLQLGRAAEAAQLRRFVSSQLFFADMPAIITYWFSIFSWYGGCQRVSGIEAFASW